MPWRPLPRIAFAVATFPFTPSSPADLPLELGDELYIIEEGGRDSAWLRGYLVAPPSLLAGLTSVKGQTLEARVFSGIFPRSCVEVRELLGETGADALIAAQEAAIAAATRRHEKDEENDKGVNGTDKSRKVRQRTEPRRSWLVKNTVDGDEAPAQAHSGTNGASGGIPLIPPTAGPRRSVSSSRALAAVTATPTPRSLDVPRPPAPVPMLKIGDETPTSSLEPLIDEIASCLREWHSTNLHELLLSRRYAELETLSKLVNQLDLSRRQLLHDVLTDEETAALRERTVWDLVNGNKMLGNEIIVRDPKQSGKLLTGNDNPVEVSRLQATMSLLDNPPESANDGVNLYHLMFELNEALHNSQETPVMMVNLGLKRVGEPLKQLTEAFSIELHREARRKANPPPTHGTLFTNLTSTDTGETPGSDAEVYLVVRVRMNRPLRTAFPAGKLGTSKDGEAGRKAVGSEGGSSTGKAGRKSFLWTSSIRSGSVRQRSNLASVTDESVTSKDSLDRENSPSKSQEAEPSEKTEPVEMVKKDVAVGILHLKGFWSQSQDSEQVLNLWAPSNSAQSQNGDENDDELIQDLLVSASGQYSRAKIIERIKFRIHSFQDTDADNLIRMTPTLLQNISKTARIGFSGAPTKPRSDIYITIQQPVLPGQALFSHPEKGSVPLGVSLEMQNLQLTLEIRRSGGDRVEDCIFAASNSSGATVFRTTTIPNTGVWAQTVRLAIPDDIVPDCHLIMSLADSPGYPFAICWMPLWRAGAFPPDGSHVPLFHLYDKATSGNTAGGRPAYLDLPWDSKAKDMPGRASWANMAHLKLETYLCSTAFSQDQALLGILRWREQSDSDLLVLLRQLVFVPEIELVKLMSDVFDALFAILVDRSGSDEFEDVIFVALVTILGIVHDRRFNLGPLVNEYTDVRFHYPFATPCLIRSFLRLITQPADFQNSKQLRATFKVGRQIMKFIVVARTQQKQKEAGIGIKNAGPVFTKDFKKIFQALQEIMRDESPSVVGSKTLLVQHLHAWLPELVPLFSSDEIMDIAINFLDACRDVTGKLILHKLVLIYNLSKSVNMLKPEQQGVFHEKVEVWLAPYWGTTADPNEQYRDQVRLCCSILTLRDGVYGAQLVPYYIKILQSYHYLRNKDQPQTQSLSLLFPTSYPFPSRPVKVSRTYNEALIELAALKATISAEQLVSHISELGGLASFLQLELEVDSSILSGEAFPSSWLTLHVYHHRHLLSMFDGAAQLMTQSLLPPPEDADSFNTELWRGLQVAVLRLVRSEALGLETLPEQKRRAVWKIAGDIREQGAELLGRTWDALGWDTDPEEKRQYGLHRLGGYQVQYVPSLVGPIVELCLSVHEGLRAVAVEILQSMIISEWTLNEDLAVVQAEMIYSLDDLFRSRNLGENVQQRPFVGQLVELFEPLAETADKELWEATSNLIATIDRLLDLLVAVHQPDISETLRIMNTLKLMDFLRNMQKEDIYITYVHQLATVQAESRNYREAGLALGLHATLYSWDITQRLEDLKDPPFTKQTAFERKESLYFAMITHFEEGGAWEPALTCYQELADQYQNCVYDFAKLARTQRSMAKIYELIARGEGQVSRYFRVVFSGLGFSTHLRGQQFIYEGSSSDRLVSFMDRLQQQHPSAQFVTQPTNHDDDEGQYLQVTAVSPHRDLGHILYQRHKVPLSTKEYLFGTSACRFSVTTRRHSPKTGVKDQWVEKTVYTTADTFPTILRRSEIVEEEILSLSPLETAVERTARKTSELVILEKRVRSGDTSSVHNMLDAIRSSIDPHSTTSVAQYRDILPLFKDPSTENAQDEDGEARPAPPPQLEPLEVALQTALLDFTSGLRQCLNLLSQKMPKADHQNLTAVFQATFAPELAVLNPQPIAAPPTPPPAFAPTSRPGSAATPMISTPRINGDEPRALDLSTQSPSSDAKRSSRARIASMLKRHPSISSPQSPLTDGPTMNGALETSSPATKPSSSAVALPPMPEVDGEKERAASPAPVELEAQPSPGREDKLAATRAEPRPLTGKTASTMRSKDGDGTPEKHTPKKPSSIRRRISTTLGMGRKPSQKGLSEGPMTVEEE